MGKRRGAYRILMGKPEGRRPLGRPRRKLEDNIKMDLQKWGKGAWTRLIWLRTGRGGELLWMRQWTSRFLKMRRISDWYVFYGTRCQWKIPVLNTLAARTLGAGTVTLKQVTCFSSGSSCWTIYPRQATTHPILPTFLNTFQVSSYQNWTVPRSHDCSYYVSTSILASSTPLIAETRCSTHTRLR